MVNFLSPLCQRYCLERQHVQVTGCSCRAERAHSCLCEITSHGQAMLRRLHSRKRPRSYHAFVGSSWSWQTLTAGLVAETMKVPLYVMGAGGLGTDPSGVEKSLSNILEMNTRWYAILLLDEADVFLEARSAHDLERISSFLSSLGSWSTMKASCS